jgi:hypothetical protein
MDAETWNEKLRQMRAADERSSRLMEAHQAIERARAIVEALGLEAMARQLDEPYGESFSLAAQTQSYAADLYTELEAAHDAGEVPPA